MPVGARAAMSIVEGRGKHHGARYARKRDSEVADKFPHSPSPCYVRNSSAEYCLALRP
jgi:hypothetical protein